MIKNKLSLNIIQSILSHTVMSMMKECSNKNKIKDNLLLIYQLLSLMMLFKDLNKTQKNKSSNK
jgi:hypothetical protein